MVDEPIQNEEEKDNNKFENLIDWEFLKKFC